MATRAEYLKEVYHKVETFPELGMIFASDCVVDNLRGSSFVPLIATFPKKVLEIRVFTVAFSQIFINGKVSGVYKDQKPDDLVALARKALAT